MADPKVPKRLHILRALTDKLKEITPANGYTSDLSDAVFRGRNYFGQGDPLPMVAILQSPRTLEQLPPPGQGTQYHGPTELLIQGFTPEDRMNPTDPAEYLMAEVKSCLAEVIDAINASPTMQWQGITRLTLGPGVCRPADDEVSSVTYFWLSVTIEFTENVRDVYAVPAA